MLIKQLTRSDVAMLGQLQTIYVEAIPASERKANSWLAQAAGRRDYSLCAGVVDEEVVGFGILFLPLNEPIALLEYFAVDIAFRGRGIGTEFISRIVASTGERCVLAEVESGHEKGNVRRQEFYRRMGFRRVAALSYLLPLDSSPPPMDLLLLNPPDPFPRPILSDWLTVIYRDVYGQPANDARLERMISQLSDPIRLD